ncbi:MAG: methylmalonyl-CoA mutase family protein, partial [Mucilaginibacter sp.]
SGDRVIVGVNKFMQNDPPAENVFRVDDSIRVAQSDKLKTLRAERNNEAVDTALKALKDAAKGTANLVPFILTAVECYATLGEIADTMRGVFGEY